MCQKVQTAFQIDQKDNVATALTPIHPGEVTLRGDGNLSRIQAIEEIPQGHKIALQRIEEGELISKYGVPIGCAIETIPAGSWVHLHVMRSLYDERSSHLDAITGAPKDIRYE